MYSNTGSWPKKIEVALTVPPKKHNGTNAKFSIWRDLRFSSEEGHQQASYFYAL